MLKIIVWLLLLAAFLLLFIWLASESLIRKLMHRTFESMDAAARQRVHENRKLLAMFENRNGFWHGIERRLMYTGLSGKYRWLTPEIWVLLNLILCAAGYFMVLLITGSFVGALAAMAVVQVIRYLIESMLMSRNYRLVNDNLMKFLDFLGNYSITAGEVTGILNQISKYLDEPLRSVLDECYYEAQVSGDTSLALLAMAEKIEHPRFKELVRNMEVSVRYSADFTALVRNSRRAVREHMRTRQERKALVNEALINMLILVGMSVAILLSVEQLIGISMQQLMLQTLPGRISLTVIVFIFVLLYLQIRRLDQ